VAPFSLEQLGHRASCTFSADGRLSELNCFLNGACVGGRCACSAAWTGEHCDALNLVDRPDPRLGYHGVDGTGTGSSSNNSSNGGGSSSSAAGRLSSWGADGTYHALISEMGGGVGLLLWECASRIIHATSPDPLTAPFVKQREVFGSFAHEPRCAPIPPPIPAAAAAAAAASASTSTTPPSENATAAKSASVCFFVYNPLAGGQPALGEHCGGGNGSTPARCDCAADFRFRAPTAMSHTADIDSGVWSEPVVVAAIPVAPDSNMSPVVFANGSLHWTASRSASYRWLWRVWSAPW
jgi:hypothetical protein